MKNILEQVEREIRVWENSKAMAEQMLENKKQIIKKENKKTKNKELKELEEQYSHVIDEILITLRTLTWVKNITNEEIAKDAE